MCFVHTFLTTKDRSYVQMSASVQSTYIQLSQGWNNAKCFQNNFNDYLQVLNLDLTLKKNVIIGQIQHMVHSLKLLYIYIQDQDSQAVTHIPFYYSQTRALPIYGQNVNVICHPYITDILRYNPPSNFCARSLDKTHHVVQNRTTDISEYTPSDLISVARFCRQAQNKRMKSPYSILTV